ncbi:PilZ domain-containing protein [Bradyrhizobium sp. GCM10023182]|uniref:PilZ domain-containing protein n=1 Tax=Bradyrhizobium zhengyangense TaxID=2911009 RepID=A0ABS9LXU7_9BRAD|nr:PilZ domain-containing protein [Bradyrhizobium zhengyangense]MCG2671851.1 PilZ domain-containing protein [Bradyrhizobium zhengyangense]
MLKEKERESQRVSFERPLSAQMMSIDGTWRRPCLVKDVSESDATLRIETSIEGLALTEFFLLLSSTGLAYQRCQLDRINGDELEVSFLRQKARKRSSREMPA